MTLDLKDTTIVKIIDNSSVYNKLLI